MRHKHRQGRGLWRLAAVAGALACLGLVSATQASAAGYVEKEQFGATAEPTFARASSLAVDPASGDLLAVDVREVAPLEFTGTIARFNPDGTPDDFADLGTNVINGEGSGPPCTPPSPECDGTPQGKLSFGFANPREMQVAVAPPGAAAGTEGNIYVTQPRNSLNLVDVFSKDGSYLGQLTVSSEGAFGITAGVAVDAAGAIYISDLTNGKVHKFLPTSNSPFAATNTTNYTRTSAATLAAGAGPSAGAIFADRFGEEPVKIASEGGEEGTQQCKVASGSSVALALDRVTGHLLSASATEVKEYEGSCASEPEAALRSFKPSGGGIRGLAVDGERELVYVAREGHATIEVWETAKLPEATTAEANPVGIEEATLNGEVNPNGLPLTACYFAYGPITAYGTKAPCAEYEEGGAWHPLASPADLNGSGDVKVRSNVTLGAGTKYHFQLFATNENSPAGEPSGGGDETLMTLGAAISGESATQVTSTTARIGARINPNGQATSYYVQYLDEASYLANPVLDRFAGASTSAVVAIPPTVTGTGFLSEGSKVLTGLVTTQGTFGAGQAISGAGIPPGTTIEAVLGPTELELSNAATEDAKTTPLSATGPQPVFAQLSGLAPDTPYRFRVVAQNAYRAFGATGRFATFLAAAGVRLPDGRAYEMVTPAQKAGEALPPEPTGSLGGSCSECLPGENQPTLPMQAAPSGDAVLYAGQPFSGGLASGPNQYLSGRGGSGWGWQSLSAPTTTGRWQAFSEGLSRGILAQATPTLSPLAPARGGTGFANLYLWSEGSALTPLVTVEPPHRGPGTGAGNQFEARFAAANAGTPSAPAFSHIAFEANDALTGDAPEAEAGQCAVAHCDLYEWSGGQLHLVNVAPGGAALGEAVIGSGRLLNTAGVEYEAPNTANAVSADGRKVFFSSEASGQAYARLDAARTLMIPGPGSCKESVPLAERACFLTASADGTRVLLSNGAIYALNGPETAYAPSLDLSEGQGGFKGILGASADLNTVYFIDSAALPGAAGQVNASGEAAQAGAFNLYARIGAQTRFVGRLDSADGGFGTASRYGSWKAAPSDRTAQVSPDGRFAAFMSRARLTGYDNTKAGGGECREHEGPECLEVFEYAADTNTLSCASCDPSGERPLGPSNLSLLRPGSRTAPPFRQPANLSPSGGGRLFFESQDAISSQDVNGHIQDVYEFEPAGIGSCTRPAGCVSLISSGHAAGDSMFLGSSASGEDAFFITRQRLLASDQDSQLDLYDARVGGGFPEEAAPSCSGEACRGAPSSPPAEPSGASSTFVGPGNPKPPAGKSCAKQAKQAKQLSGRAKRLRRNAKKASDPKKARQRRAKANRLAKRAKRKSSQAKACRKGGASSSKVRRRSHTAHRGAHPGRRTRR